MSPVPGVSAPRATLGDAFDPRGNSLNLLRLVFATMVLVGHSVGLGGYGSDHLGDVTTIGELAVFGFFAISGFLIAGSASTSAPRDYLRRRFLRIFPAFWVALAVTASVIAPLIYLLRPPLPGCGIDCYLTAEDGPFGYLWRNATLWIVQPAIAGTPADVVLPGVWNGSLWTLSYEFAAYLILLGLAIVGVLRRPRLLVGLTAAVWLVVTVLTVVPSLNAQVTVLTLPVVMRGSGLLPLFLTGACLWVLRGRIPDSGRLALGSAGLALVVFLLPIGASVPAFTLTSSVVAAPLLVYPVLWLGCHLPGHRVGRRNDYSYGIYVYAFPIQQALVALGVAAAWGLLGFTALTMVLTLGLAALSWHLIERPAMRLGRRRRAALRTGPAATARPSDTLPANSPPEAA